MKKLLSGLLAFLLVTALSIPAFAASGLNSYETKLLNTIKSGVEIGGKTYNIDQYYNKAYNYLNRDGVDLTEAQYNAVIDGLDKGVALLETETGKAAVKSGVIDISALNDDDRQAFIKIVNDVASVCELTVSWDASGVITIRDKDGNIIISEDPVIKATDSPKADSVLLTYIYVTLGFSFVGMIVLFFLNRHSKTKADENA